MKLKIGDIACLYRRDSPGVGMVIDKIDNIIDNEVIEVELQALIADWNHGNDFRSRNHAISRFIDKSGLGEDLVMAFLTSNGFYRYSRQAPRKNMNKINKSYIKIFWMMKPSNYNIKIIRRNIDWFPAKWLKVPKKQKKNT